MTVREALAPVIRAAGITAAVAGTAFLLLRPPSFSGAQGLLVILAGAVVLVFVTAWITVHLSGRRSMSEREFERLVRRSEELARSPALAREATGFELLVAEAIDRLPEEFRRLLDEMPVVVSHGGHAAGAYGHYLGDTVAREYHADRIVLYQDTLERDFGHDVELLSAQVERTLRHEIAHHLGWDERGVHGLGL
jgi:predicted Zn-dependent protease with MMP-like domain